jgi:ABC-type transporter Mla subunit MlaD
LSNDAISLREYVDTRFEAQDKAVTAALAAQEKAVAAALAAADRAVAKAENASEKRFENVNEFRASLNDQSRLLMPRSESEQAIRSITEKIDILTTRVNSRDDRGIGRTDVAGWIVGAVGLLSALVAIIYTVTK